MKLKIKKPKEQDILELELQDNQDGTIAVVFNDWSLVTFGINDNGKIAIARNGFLTDPRVEVDGANKIVEIPEGDFVEVD